MGYAIWMNLVSFGGTLLFIGGAGLVVLVVYFAILPSVVKKRAQLERYERQQIRKAEREEIGQSDLPPATKKRRLN